MAFNSNFFDPFGDLKTKNKKTFSDDPLDFGYGNTDATDAKAKNCGGEGGGSGSDDNSCRRRSGSSSPSPDDDDVPEDEEWPSAPPIDILDSIKARTLGQHFDFPPKLYISLVQKL